MSHTAQLSINNSNSQQLVEISPQFTSNVILPQKCKKPSDCLVFGCNILITKWLTIWRLSGNCLDGLLMKVIVRWKELPDVRNSDDRNRMRWQNPVIREYGYYNINLLGICLTANLPNRGKHVAHDGQARYPCWASIVPNFSPNPSLDRFMYFYILLAVFCFL